MSDESNGGTNPALSSAVDAMVAASGSAGPQRPEGPAAGITFTSSDDAIFYGAAGGLVQELPNGDYSLAIGGEVPASELPGAIAMMMHLANEREHDSGTRTSPQEWNDKLAFLTSRLEEHRFDARTGEKIYTLPLNSDQRRVHENARAQLLNSHASQQLIDRALEDQRERDRKDRLNRDAVDARAVDFTKHDATRASILAEELARAEARIVVADMLAMRKARVIERLQEKLASKRTIEAMKAHMRERGFNPDNE